MELVGYRDVVKPSLWTQTSCSDSITAASPQEPVLMYLPSASPSWKAEVNYELSWVKGGARTALNGVT